jgi:thiol-disulfide isomerase/thioredoxin
MRISMVQSSRTISLVMLGMVSLLAGGFCSGCARPEDAVAPDGGAESSRDDETHATGAHAGDAHGDDDSQSAAGVALRAIDAAGFEKARAAHQGQVIFVDYWATWCGVCREEFPHTVELHRKYGDQGLVVMSLAMDEADKRPMALDFLKEQQATFENFLAEGGYSEEAYAAFNVQELPEFHLYDRQGKLLRRISLSDPTADPVTREDIEAAVEEALAAKPAE